MKGPLLGSKRVYFDLQRDTFADRDSYLAYKERALGWLLAQDS